jgi:FixJ family two-component response regulator
MQSAVSPRFRFLPFPGAYSAHRQVCARSARDVRVTATDRIVYVVDDDLRIREATSDLLAAFGLQAVTFGSAAEYIAYPRPDVPACLVLDLELPDINGLDLQGRISQGNHPPIVFITGHGDIPASVRAIKAGAVDFLTKPFHAPDLMNAIQAAIARDVDSRLRRAELAELGLRLSSLTPRERDVLPLVVGGLLNKQAAAELGISEVTLQIHRGKIMRKMRAASLPDLVRIAEALAIPTNRHRRAR